MQENLMTIPLSSQAKSALLINPLPPTLYHLTQTTNWPSIEKHGLLSTQALLDLVGLSGREREHMAYRHRAERVVLPNGVIISDQRPMPPTALKRCLHGVTPEEWYALLNSKVFFWLDSERLSRLRCVYRAIPQIVMSIDTQRLLASYAEQIALTPINTGNARRQPAQRGLSTFVPYKTWLASGWTSETEALHTRPRLRSHPPAELTVAYAVPDVMDFVTDVQRLAVGEILSL
jgi:hypothetical protein